MPVRLYAHRGAAAERPENTLPSFRRALELGADALEMDLHATSDGVVVVSHDPDGARLAGVAREIRQVALSELRTWDVGGGAHIPTFTEVLEAFPDVVVNVDIKQREPDIVPAVLDVVRRMSAAERVIIASFYSDILRRVRALGYRGQTSLGREEVLAVRMLPLAALRRIRGRLGDAVQIPVVAGPFRLASAEFIEKCHALGLRVDFWTINDVTQARALVALGADGIMTDDPARMAPALRDVPRT